MPNTQCYINAYDQVNLYIMDLFNIGVLTVAITSDSVVFWLNNLLELCDSSRDVNIIKTNSM
jgi:hypothetical protein